MTTDKEMQRIIRTYIPVFNHIGKSKKMDDFLELQHLPKLNQNQIM